MEPHPRRWAILGVLCLSLVLVVLGNSVLNVAIPTLQRELGASNADLQWIVDAYALVFGGMLLSMGALGDRFGRRGALQAGLAITAAGSALAVFAQDAPMLIASRAVMGFGAALVMPATLSILTTVFPREERGKAMGIWAAFAGVGGAIGPVVGGWLLEAFAWQSIFYLNFPVVAVAMAGGFWLVPTSRDPNQTRLDPIGALLSIVVLGSLLFAIIEGPGRGWSDAYVLAGFVIGGLTFPLFVWYETRTEHAMLPMRFFRHRGFNMGNIAIAMSFFVMFAFFFIMTQFLQFVQDYSPLQAGIRMLPLAAGMMLAAPNSDAVVKRLGTPRTVALGLLLLAFCFGGLGLATPTTPYLPLGLAFLGLGIGMGLAMAPSTTLIMDSVPGHKAGVGSAMNDTSREVGGAFGIAVLGSVLNDLYQSNVRVPDGVPGAAQTSIGAALRAGQSIGGEVGAALEASARSAFMDGMAAAYLAGAAVALLAAVLVFFRMPRRLAMERPDRVAPDAEGWHVAGTAVRVGPPEPAPVRRTEDRTGETPVACPLSELHARVDAALQRLR